MRRKKYLSRRPDALSAAGALSAGALFAGALSAGALSAGALSADMLMADMPTAESTSRMFDEFNANIIDLKLNFS